MEKTKLKLMFYDLRGNIVLTVSMLENQKIDLLLLNKILDSKNLLNKVSVYARKHDICYDIRDIITDKLMYRMEWGK